MVGDSGKAVDEVMIQPQEPFRLSHPHFAIFQYHDRPGSLCASSCWGIRCLAS